MLLLMVLGGFGRFLLVGIVALLLVMGGLV